jgi:hypothetical protein
VEWCPGRRRGSEANKLVNVKGVSTVEWPTNPFAILTFISAPAVLRLLFERNLAGVVRTSLEGRILECNPAAKRGGPDALYRTGDVRTSQPPLGALLNRSSKIAIRPIRSSS